MTVHAIGHQGSQRDSGRWERGPTLTSAGVMDSGVTIRAGNKIPRAHRRVGRWGKELAIDSATVLAACSGPVSAGARANQ
ncbi:MAG: hypothetical protein K8E66_05465 [Phycisphaerales bacterium]|nr:hypothetical protein [Phycisphaerales bacterium]